MVCKGVGTRGGGVEGRGPCACPGGGCDCAGIQGIHGRASQQDGDKHEAPTSAPHRPLSLRTSDGLRWYSKRSWVGNPTGWGQARGPRIRLTPPLVPTRGDELRPIEGEGRCRCAGTSVDTFASLLWIEM